MSKSERKKILWVASKTKEVKFDSKSSMKVGEQNVEGRGDGINSTSTFKNDATLPVIERRIRYVDALTTDHMMRRKQF
jgi:hypothetical protein